MKDIAKLTTEEKLELTKSTRFLIDDLNRIISYLRETEKKILADTAVEKLIEEQKKAAKPAAKRGRPIKKFRFIK